MGPENSRPKVNLQIEKEATTLRGRVERKLRFAIVSGHFVPGQRLVERELCELMGVGRTSVREAMRQLEAEGLISSVPHRGPIVQGITTEEATQLYALRVLLEGYLSSEIEEFLGFAHRVDVFVNGSIFRSLDGAMIEEEAMLAAMFGQPLGTHVEIA